MCSIFHERAANKHNNVAIFVDCAIICCELRDTGALPMRKELTEKQSEFIRHFVEIGDHMRAATLAGYKDGTNQGRELRRKLAAEIEEAIREQMGSYVPLALKTIASLAQSSEQDSVRLKACSELLSRSGFDAVQKIEQTNLNGDSDRDDEALRKELASLVKRMPAPPAELKAVAGLDVAERGKGEKDVSPAPAHAH